MSISQAKLRWTPKRKYPPYLLTLTYSNQLNFSTVSCEDEDAWQKEPSANTANKCSLSAKCGVWEACVAVIWNLGKKKKLQTFICASEMKPDLLVLSSASAWAVVDSLLKV